MTILNWLSSKAKRGKASRRKSSSRKRRRCLEALETRRLLAADPIAGNYSINEGESLSLAAVISGPDTPVAIEWDLDDDGQFDDASGASTIVHWRNLEELGIRDDGVYDIAVQATWVDSGGTTQFDVSTGQLDVSNVEPDAILLSGVEEVVHEGETATVLLFAMDPALADTEAGFLHSYDFDNDGTFEVVDTTETVQSFVTSTSPVQVVRAISVDKDGGVRESFLGVAVEEVAPTFNVNGGTAPTEGIPYEVDIQVNDPGNDQITSWTIDWGDGVSETFAGHEPTPSHAYAEDGQYEINVTVSYTDDNGLSSESLPPWTIEVTNATPFFTSLISSNDNPSNNSTTGLISLEGSFQDLGTQDIHLIVIDWGDGSSTILDESDLASDQFIRTHLYSQPGLYTITATVTDDEGASASFSTSAYYQFFDADGDGVDDANDLDGDNDGIPDSEEDIVATPEVTEWEQSGSGLNGGDGTIAYTYQAGSTTGWNESATSAPLSTLGFDDSFEFSFTVDQSSIRYLMIGINEAGTDDGSGGYADIDHAIYLSGNRFYVYRNGVYGGQFGRFSAGDTFAIRVDGGTLEYQRNGSTFESESVTPGLDYYVDSSAYNSNFSGTYSLSDVEVTNLDGSLPDLTDLDGDGVPNSEDLDSDNDGIADLYESGNAAAIALDANGDGFLDITEAVDSDSDGILDVYEGSDLNSNIGLEPVDTDGDGIVDLYDLDSDNDSIPDTVEARPSFGYVTNDGDVTDDDSDGDGVLDMFDVDSVFGSSYVNFMSPHADPNDIWDDIPDYLDSDSDGDGFDDIDESGIVPTYRFKYGITTAVNANYSDPDGDINAPLGSSAGLQNVDADSTDVDFRSFADIDADGVGDGIDIDNDNDGLLDSVEGQAPNGLVNQWTPTSGNAITMGNGTFAYSYVASQPNGWTQSVQSSDISELGYSDAFRLSFNVDQASVQYLMIGLNQAGTDDGTGGYQDIDHAIYLSGNRIYVFESSNYAGYFGQFSAGDNFAIEVDGATLRYLHNGNEFLSSGIDAGKDYFIDTSAYNANFSTNYTLSNIEVTNLDGSFAVSSDSENDGTLNHLDLDSDNDGESDLVESGLATTIVAADTDSNGSVSYSEALSWLQSNIDIGISTADANDDGLLDIFDSSVNTMLSSGTFGTTPVDSNNDGTPDFLDPTS